MDSPHTGTELPSVSIPWRHYARCLTTADSHLIEQILLSKQKSHLPRRCEISCWLCRIPRMNLNFPELRWPTHGRRQMWHHSVKFHHFPVVCKLPAIFPGLIVINEASGLLWFGTWMNNDSMSAFLPGLNISISFYGIVLSLISPNVLEQTAVEPSMPFISQDSTCWLPIQDVYDLTLTVSTEQAVNLCHCV